MNIDTLGPEERAIWEESMRHLGLDVKETRYRTPVGVVSQIAGRSHIVCDDGSMWTWFERDDPPGWKETRTPIPGTKRAAELEDKDGS